MIKWGDGGKVFDISVLAAIRQKFSWFSGSTPEQLQHGKYLTWV